MRKAKQRRGLPKGAHRVRMEVRFHHATRAWLVARNRQTEASGFPTKQDALIYAMDEAKAVVAEGRFVSVRIHGRDGRYQSERTLPRGSDPFPPKG